MNSRVRLITLLWIVSVFAVPVSGQEQSAAPTTDAEGLAKKLSNPVADLVSIPFQFNWENGVGPEEGTRYILNIQPVVPFSISEKMNLIGRWIMPYVSQPTLVSGGEPVSGMSDIVASGFFSPVGSGGLTWGVGPVFSLPATSDPRLGSGKWSIGPTAVVLKQSGPWTYGALVNHLWSFADADDTDRPDVNQTYIQPFLAHTSKSAVTFTLQSESTANWKADSGEEWTIPINVLVSKVTKLGPFPFSVAGGVGVFVEQPDGGPEWKVRTAFTLILPRKS